MCVCVCSLNAHTVFKFSPPTRIDRSIGGPRRTSRGISRYLHQQFSLCMQMSRVISGVTEGVTSNLQNFRHMPFVTEENK